MARCSGPSHRRAADASALHEGSFWFNRARRHDPIKSGDTKIEGFFVRFCDSSNAMAPIDPENPLPHIPTAFWKVRTVLVGVRTEFVFIAEHLKRCRSC